MMRRMLWAVPLVAGLWLGLPSSAPASQAPEPVVWALFFHSPQCPHCDDVMRDHFPALLERHGVALRVVAVNVDTREGQALYQAIARHFQLSRQRMGVPALVVGDRMLVGAWEIPSQLPRIVESGLAAGGIGWPAIEGVSTFLAGQGPPAAELLTAAGAPVSTPSVRARYMRDPVGNSMAVVVLLAMIGVLGLALREVSRPKRDLAEMPGWVVPALAVAGLGVAAYLAFVEVTGTEAICGPVGDCHTVQLSPYALVFGVPVGVIGVAGYVVLAGAWAVARLGPASIRAGVTMAVWVMAVGGVLFSIYLTFLEPFVIGATCMWCLNSAVIMTLIMMVTTPAAARLRAGARLPATARLRTRNGRAAS